MSLSPSHTTRVDPSPELLAESHRSVSPTVSELTILFNNKANASGNGNPYGSPPLRRRRFSTSGSEKDSVEVKEVKSASDSSTDFQLDLNPVNDFPLLKKKRFLRDSPKDEDHIELEEVESTSDISPNFQWGSNSVDVSPPLNQRGASFEKFEGCIEEEEVDKKKESPESSFLDGVSSDPSPHLHLDLGRIKKEKKKPVRVRLKRSFSKRLSSYTSSPRNAKVSSPRMKESIFPLDEKFDISDIPVLEKKDVKEFEKNIKQCMNKAWASSEKMGVSALVIEKSIQKLCREEIDHLFQHEKNPLAADLNRGESPRAKNIIALVQNSGTILFPVLNRMQILRTAVINHVIQKNKVSPSIHRLIGFLDDLVLLEDDLSNQGLKKGKNISSFMEKWDNFYGKKEMNPYAKIILEAFGDTKRERKEVMATLRKWVKPPPEILGTIKKNVHKMDWDNISAMNVPHIPHDWKEPSKSQNLISKIMPKEIVRSLHQGHGIPMKRFTINREVIYDDEIDGNVRFPTQKSFISHVIRKLYAIGFKEVISEDQVEQYTNRLIEVAKLPEEEQKDPSIDKELPFINVLRLVTFNAWGHADTFIRATFPDLFEFPYWTKNSLNIEYDITICKNGVYFAQINNKYVAFHRLEKNACRVDKNKPLMDIPFNWTLAPSGRLHDGTLKKSFNLLSEVGEDKWPLIYCLINYKEQETTPEENKAPRGLRMRSTPSSPLAFPTEDPDSEKETFGTRASTYAGSSKGKERDDSLLPLSGSAPTSCLSSGSPP